jgi:peptide/nickel transport system permease protein
MGVSLPSFSPGPPCFLVPDDTGVLEAIDAYVLPLLERAYAAFGYLGVVLAMTIESAAIPIPSEIILPFAGFSVSRGIPEGRVVRKHAFRNALVPVITVIGLQVALTMSGAVLTEITFNWPGLGTALINYLNARDYIAVQGLVTFIAVVVVIVSVFVDILNALVDPRVRY